MKKIILILITIFGIQNGFAQQFPLQSQYQFNYSSINPAAVGEFDYLKMVASYRNQWAGFNTQNDQAIATQYLSFTKGFASNGLGFTLLNDNTGGALNTSGFRLSYSHKVIYDTHELFLGISGGGTKVKMNMSNFNDPAVLTNSDFLPEATFGAYVLIQDWKLGFSIPGMLNQNIELTSSSQNQIQSHFYTMISYTKELNDDWALYPSVLIKNTKNHQQVDANLNIKLRNQIWFGASYRTSPDENNLVQEAFGPSFYLGIDLGQFFSIYSHDLSSGSLSSYPTHEITIGYDFISDSEIDQEVNKNNEEKIDENIVNDRDNDGITDSLDLCPDEYGKEVANGCPDFDKDGIPDKYDLCPHLFGNSTLQGCPELTSNESDILSMALKDLRFNIDKSVIEYESFGSMTNLVLLMHKNPKMILVIEGHASSEGSSLYNLNLSAQRSKAVQQFFIERGIAKERLSIDFYGEEAPLNSNRTEQERAENRRVHFEITYHITDRLLADKLQAEYDSLLNIIYGEVPSIKATEKNNILQERVIDASIQEVDNSKLVIKSEAVINSRKVIYNSYEDSLAALNINKKNTISDKGKYLVIVQVFTDLSNAIQYTNSNQGSLEYTLIKDKYYVFAFSSDKRKDAEIFRDKFKEGSWVLDL
jgi:type IX secretion system PorP/SprF family membrane protein